MSFYKNFLLITLFVLPSISFGCGTEDCPIDCEDKYKCVDRSDKCADMKSQCENFFFRKCMRCACPKTCGVCDASSSEENEPEYITNSTSTSTTTSTQSSTSPPSPSSPMTTTEEVYIYTSTNVSRTPVKKRYPNAKLQVCHCNLDQYPELEGFVYNLDHKQGWATEFVGQVQSEIVPGIQPTLVLLNANGKAAKTIKIGKWSVAKLRKFLEDNLEHATNSTANNGTKTFGIHVGNGTIPIGNATSLKNTKKWLQNNSNSPSMIEDSLI